MEAYEATPGDRRAIAVMEKDMVELDEIDHKLIELLKKDGRVAIAELARHVGLSRVGASDRLNRLKEKGVIRGFIALIDNLSVGWVCSAFFDIEVTPKHIDYVAQKLSEHPEIIVVYLMTGGTKLHAHALLKDNTHLAEFLRKDIYTIKGVKNVETSIMLKRYKSELNLL